MNNEELIKENLLLKEEIEYINKNDHYVFKFRLSHLQINKRKMKK